MAEYLVQDTTLDAIADAINAKTGGSSAMTPAQMVTEIGSISGGGGVSEIVTIGENTVSNMSAALNYLFGLSTLDLSSGDYVISLESGYESPINNQLGGVVCYVLEHAGMAAAAKRYRGSSWSSAEISSAYDCALVVGSTYIITVLE